MQHSLEFPLMCRYTPAAANHFVVALFFPAPFDLGPEVPSNGGCDNDWGLVVVGKEVCTSNAAAHRLAGGIIVKTEWIVACRGGRTTYTTDHFKKPTMSFTGPHVGGGRALMKAGH